MKKIVFVLIFMAMFSILAYCENYPYIDFSKNVDYNLIIGGEFPGTEAKAFVENNLLKIEYNHNGTGKYCQANFILGNVSLTGAKGLSFTCKGVKGEGILFRLFDGDGETYQKNILIDSDDFTTYEIIFADLEQGQHWGGSGNGKLDLPISGFAIGPEKHEVDKGEFYIKNVDFISDDIDTLKEEIVSLGLEKISFELDTGKPGNLIYFNEPTKAKIVLKNNILTNVNISMNLDFLSPYGKKIKSSKLSLNSDKENFIELPNVKGYVEVQYTATLNKSITKEGSFYYGIIPDNSKIMGGKTSYFGVNCHFNHGWDPMFAKIVKRAGISWVREGEASLNDLAYPILKENGLQYMPCFTGMQEKSYKYIEEEIAKGKSPHDKWDFSNFVGEFGEFAKKYGDYVFLYDMLNEPNNLGWMKFGGDWTGGDWVDVFTQWSQQTSKQVRDNDPDAQILWEEIDVGCLWAKQYVKYGATNSDLDYISPHPYNLHRSNPLPENQGFLKSNADFFDFIKEKNLDWKLIDGEVGFTTYILSDETPGTSYTGYPLELQPALIVRMFVMHLTSGVERIFYYDFRNDGWNRNHQEHNFGLVLNDGNPKPGICGYANMVQQLEGAKFTGREKDFRGFADDSYDYTHVYGYINRDGKKSVCAWALDNPETISFETKSKDVKLIDLYGNETKLTPKNGKISVKLTEYPIYVVGL